MDSRSIVVAVLCIGNLSLGRGYASKQYIRHNVQRNVSVTRGAPVEATRLTDLPENTPNKRRPQGRVP